MAIEYVPYFPTTIEGQAILNNFVRTQRLLRYRDNDRIVRSVKRGMPLYETTLQETVGDAGSGNMLVRGECLSACAYLKKKIDAGEMRPIDLVYIDPPFASGADYAKQVFMRRNPKKADEAREAETQLEDDELQSFEETMYGDIWDKERYLNWMYENLMAIKTVMGPNASIFVHLDWHIVHYVKVMMDEVFGESQFVNEIIWQRTDPHNDAKTRLGRIHDTIFWYSLAEKPLYNWADVTTDLSPAALKEYKDVKLPDGSVVPYRNDEAYPEGSRRFKLDDCTWKGSSSAGKFTWRGATPSSKRVWPYDSPEEMDAAVERGEFYLRDPNKGAARCRVSYLDEREGQLLQTIWQDCGRMKGGTEYATQKPVPLLERIIKAASDEGMLIADFFGGSGTTAVAAATTNRHFIHVDVGINSIQIARERLREIGGVSFDVYEVRDGVSLYRNPVQTMEQIKRLIPGLCNEDALDKFWEGSFRSADDGMVPVYIPNLTDSTTKFLDKVLAMRIINEAMPDLPGSTKKVVVFYVDIVDEGEIRDFIAEYNDTGIEIELRDLKPLLAEVVSADEVDFDVSEGGDNLMDRYRTTITSFTSDRLEGKISEYNAKGVLQGKKGFKPLSVSEDGLELIECVSLDCTASEGAWHADSEIYIDRYGYAFKDGKPTDKLWDGSVCSERRPLRIRVRNIAGDEAIEAVPER